MQITYYGHSCFSFRREGLQILFDPFITPNELTKGKADASSLQADYILISHGHEDHIADAFDIAMRTNAVVVSNYEIITWLAAKGVKKYHPMNIGGSVKMPFGKLKYVPAIHSSMLPDRSYGGSPGGFVLDFGDLCIYYAGDTALYSDMQLIAKEFDIQYAILPIGDNFTMGADDAVEAAALLRCTRIIGMHYDTFPYIEIDHKMAKEKFTQAGLSLTLMEIGETIEI